jgi:sulfur carrier protein
MTAIPTAPLAPNAEGATPASINLVVNGIAQASTAHTLAQWVEVQGLAGNALATAVNGQFVSRAMRAQCNLGEGDTILTFQPIEGG